MDKYTKIAYLGPEGTFTEEALIKYLEYDKDSENKTASEVNKIACSTIPDVIRSVDRGEVQKGIVPIENSIEGSVNLTLDILTFESEAKIVAEITIPIKHHLIGKKNIKIKQIKRIISHPHAYAQCRIYLNRRFPEAEIIAANSTAEAVKKLKETDDSTVAIGTYTAAEIYNLDILFSDIEDNKENKTRFAIISNFIAERTTNDKTSIVCFLKKDKPGSLFNILKEFAERNINLTRLESRPAKKDLGDYVFMIDLEGHIHDRVVYEALESLRNNVYLVKLLGSYPAWKNRGQ